MHKKSKKHSCQRSKNLIQDIHIHIYILEIITSQREYILLKGCKGLTVEQKTYTSGKEEDPCILV